MDWLVVNGVVLELHLGVLANWRCWVCSVVTVALVVFW